MPRGRARTLVAAPAAAAAAGCALAARTAAADEVFTTNAVCRRNQCINPLFPGLEDLHVLEEAPWFCSSLQRVVESDGMSFCSGAVNYDPSLPALGGTEDIKLSVKKQDEAALSMFFYHLAGMGKDAFEYKDLDYADDCTRSIWRMVCYTYFPRAKLGCQEGMGTTYVRPCQSSCQNYVRACGVECCDESVQCVFSHRKTIHNSVQMVQHGYVPHDGPSSLCTGAARRSAAPAPGQWLWLLLGAHVAASALGPSSGASRADSAAPAAAAAQRKRGFAGLQRVMRLAWPLVLAVLAVCLQGCNLDVPTHTVMNWRAEPDYLIQYSFVPPGQTARFSLLNSCSMRDLSPTLQCSGRGVCRLWDERRIDTTVAFCQCDRDWADPECTTKRKSQAVAFLLSVFFGLFGADQFYLGFPIAGGLKLVTFGGCGAWWLADIMRIGSAPVDAGRFKVAADLPHWAFVLFTVMLAMLVGFGISYVTLVNHMASRRKDALILKAEEEHRLMDASRLARPQRTQGYGSIGDAATTAGGPSSRGQSAATPWPGPSY